MGSVLTAKRGVYWVGITGLVAAATVTACAGKDLDVGTDGPVGGSDSSAAGGTGGAAGGSGGAAMGAGARGNLTHEGPAIAGAEWPDPAACLLAPSSPLVGKYKGHWPLGGRSDEPTGDVVLTIKGLTADGQPCGTVRIGEGDLPPPATDPDAPYPPGQEAEGKYIGMGIGRVSAQPGADYQIFDVINSSTRLAFSIAYNELLRGWCGLQTRYPGANSCLPGTYGASQDANGCIITPEGEAPMSIPCLKLSYCNPFVCVCDEAGCDASPQPKRFDLHWDDGNLEGSVDPSTSIFLDRVP